MTNIAILSDTHGLLRPEVKAELAAADCIIHAGDINTPAIVETMQSYGDTYIVRGNNDKDWAEGLPQSLVVTIDGVRFFIVQQEGCAQEPVRRGCGGLRALPQHTAEGIGGVLWLNPGSCGKRRFDLEITLCRMTVDAGAYRFKMVLIPHESAKKGN